MTDPADLIQKLRTHASVIPWLGDAADALAAECERADGLQGRIDSGLAAIGSMSVLEAGQSYGVRLAWGEIERVQQILRAGATPPTVGSEQPTLMEHLAGAIDRARQARR